MQIKIKEKNIPETNVLIEAIIQGMQAKKAQDIILLDLQKLGSAIANYFICMYRPG